MEYTNDLIDKMYHLKDYNLLYSNYLKRMAITFTDQDMKMLGNGITSKSLLNRGYRLADCLNFWEWDKYEKNKILFLNRVERCKDERFCPNCRTLDVSKDILEMKSFVQQNYDKYDFYLLTLTVPNIYPDFDEFKNRTNEIRFAKRFNNYLDKLNDTFKKFTDKYSLDEDKRKIYRNRICQFKGGIRTLEITYSKCRSGTHYNKYGFHPHYHCLVFTDKGALDEYDLEKKYKGKWSDNKVRKFCIDNFIDYDRLSADEKLQLAAENDLFNYKSMVDTELSTVWSLLWDGKRKVTDQLVDSIGYDPQKRFMNIDNEETDIKVLEVDLRKIEDEQGIYEAIKYTFKLNDFKNLFEFSQIVFTLQNRRLRQKFGTLYNTDLSELLNKEIQPLVLQYQEVAEKLYMRDMSDIFEYKDYKKISHSAIHIDSNIED